MVIQVHWESIRRNGKGRFVTKGNGVLHNVRSVKRYGVVITYCGLYALNIKLTDNSYYFASKKEIRDGRICKNCKSVKIE